MLNDEQQSFYDYNFRLKKDYLLNLVQEIESVIEEKCLTPNCLCKLNGLQNSVIQNYDKILNLSEFRKERILGAFYIIRALGKAVNKYNLLIETNLWEEADAEAENIESILEDLRQKYKKYELKQTNPYEIQAKMQEIFAFLEPHMNLVGKEQAIKDFQTGLNLLNQKFRNSVIEAKQQLLDDGILGNKTLNCICNACKHYSPNIINKYIKKGALSNAIFNTKNNPDVDTKAKVYEICENLTNERSL